jgi:hypothetical protein
MRQLRKSLGWLLLAAALLVPVGNVGCAARVRVYDRDHDDWHNWNRDEDRDYRRYLSQRHEQYRDFQSLGGDEQNAYWNWRHDHPDSR